MIVVSAAESRLRLLPKEEGENAMLRKLMMLLAVGAIGTAGTAYAASFGEIDANGDGAVTQDEFAAAYPEAGQEAWSSADANGDGKLSEQEHQAAIEEGTLKAE